MSTDGNRFVWIGYYFDISHSKLQRVYINKHSWPIITSDIQAPLVVNSAIGITLFLRPAVLIRRKRRARIRSKTTFELIATL